MVASIPIKFYREESGKNGRSSREIDNYRIKLLNDDTGDTLTGVQFKRALVRDFLLNGAGYAFINRKAGKIKSLNYVSAGNIFVLSNCDSIFKDYNIQVQGQTFAPFNFLKILRASEDGATGKGVITENSELLSTGYTMLTYERNLVATGGNKKGFITAASKLSSEAMTALKNAWKNLYSNNEENVIVLNEGLRTCTHRFKHLLFNYFCFEFRQKCSEYAQYSCAFFLIQ
ncbi:MAG: phage portal protein, partial [Oscillospiraceae bacterium]|nr:phage portal protein [Oscillospiraceae bacterium]